MSKNSLKEKIENIIGEEENILLADNFEEAFVGIGRKFGEPHAVYDRSKCIEILMREMSYEESEEYFSFNVEGAYVGEKTPIFLEYLDDARI